MIAFTFIDEAAIGKKRHPKPIGYEDINVENVTNLTPSNVRKCVGALVKFEGGPFRERHDGGQPISSVVVVDASGYLRSDGDEYFYSRDEAPLLAVILDIENGAVNGVLRVTYYG